MKLNSILLAAIGIVIGVVATLSIEGCHTEIDYRYDSTIDEVTPVLKTGDVINWDVAVKWRRGTGPCEPGEFIASGNKTCTILKPAKPTLFTYHCEAGKYCDPDVAVDDGYTISTGAGTTATVGGGTGGTSPSGIATLDPTEPDIFLDCIDSKVVPDPWDKADRKVGELVRWRSNDTVGLPPGWRVVLNSGTLCASGETSLNEDSSCILAGTPGTAVEYTVTSNGCGAPAQNGKVTPQ